MDFCQGTHMDEPQTHPFLKQWTHAALRSMSCRVTYSYDANGVTSLAEGLTRNFSASECVISGSVLPPLGSKSTITLSLRDHQRPFSFDGVVISREGGSFRVRIAELSEHDCKRVLRWLWDLGYVNMIV